MNSIEATLVVNKKKHDFFHNKSNTELKEQTTCNYSNDFIMKLNLLHVGFFSSIVKF